MPRRALLTVLVLCAALPGCELPADSTGTLERVRGATMVVGYTDARPWVIAGGQTPSGVEPALIRGFAQHLGARIEWIEGSESELVEELRDGRIDVLLAGLPKGAPWKKEVALTRPYLRHGLPGGGAQADKPRVMAVRAGENAFLVALERHLADREGEVERLLDREAGR